MTQQTINVGADPGNLGDGDTLRNAFIKTNDNFNELYTVSYVTDVSISNHADSSINGSIAEALLNAGNNGGGVVLVGVGEFTCIDTTLTIPANVTLKGSGRRATTLSISGTQNGITMSARYSSIESLRIDMPTSSAGDGIYINTNYKTLRDLYITGGDINSWAINIDYSNVIHIENTLLGRVGASGVDSLTGNGIIFNNSIFPLQPFNYGDSLLFKIDIALNGANTTGIMCIGPVNSSTTINNNLFNQISITGSDPANGHVGVHFINTKRMSIVSLDLERLNTGVIEESTGTGSNSSRNNVYMSVYAINVITSYLSSGNVGNRTFIGNDKFFPDSLSETDILIGPSYLVMPELSSLLVNPLEGTIAQFSAGVAGVSAGLYRFKNSAWVFIG